MAALSFALLAVPERGEHSAARGAPGCAGQPSRIRWRALENNGSANATRSIARDSIPLTIPILTNLDGLKSIIISIVSLIFTHNSTYNSHIYPTIYYACVLIAAQTHQESSVGKGVDHWETPFARTRASIPQRRTNRTCRDSSLQDAQRRELRFPRHSAAHGRDPRRQRAAPPAPAARHRPPDHHRSRPHLRPTHGSQQLTLFNRFDDTACYLPLIACVTFDNEAEQYLVAALLRPGNGPSKQGMLALLRQEFPRARLRMRWMRASRAASC